MTTRNNNLPRAAFYLVAALGGYVLLALTLSSAAEDRVIRGPVVPEKVEFGPDRVAHDKMTLHKATFSYECVECHDAQKRDPNPREFIGEHSVLKFDHGLNNRCFNCHHETEYDQFVTLDGRPMAFKEHVKLCAGCHGPIYKDWKNGAHGRRSGFWDTSRGEQRRTDCIVCHDPHTPATKPMQPLAPPGVAVGVPLPPPAEPHSAMGKLLRSPPPVKPALRAPAEPVEDALP